MVVRMHGVNNNKKNLQQKKNKVIDSVSMQDYLVVLSQLPNSRAFQELPQILKIALITLSKLAIHDSSRICEIEQTVQVLANRAEQQEEALNKRPTYKEIEELTQIISRVSTGEEILSNSMDLKLTSRNCTNRLQCSNRQRSSLTSQAENRQGRGLDRIMIQEVKAITDTILDSKIKTLFAQGGIERQPNPKTPVRTENTEILQMLDNIRTDVLRIENESISSLQGQISRIGQLVSKLEEGKVDRQQFQKRFSIQRTVLADEAVRSARKSMLKSQATQNQQAAILRQNSDIENRQSFLKSGVKKFSVADQDPVGLANNQKSLSKLESKMEKLMIKVEEKAERQQLCELKTKLNRELSRTLTQSEVQRIVKKFQQEIFDKMDSDKKHIIQKAIAKASKLEVTRAIEQGGILTKQVLKQLKQALSRMEQQIMICKDATDEEVRKVKQDIKDMLDEINGSLQYRYSGTKKHLKNKRAEEQPSIGLETNPSSQITVVQCCKAKWQCTAGSKETVQGRICWEREVLNSQSDNFRWQPQKSHIFVQRAGIYEIKICVFSRRKPSGVLLVNNEAVATLESSKRGTKSKQLGHGTSLIEYVILPQKSKLNVKLDEDCRVQALFSITKFN